MSTTIWKRTGAFVMIGSMLAVNASAVAQQKPQDPDHPYAGSVTGMFHDQTAGENLGEYSVYLPSTIEQCVTGVMIAVPEDMTAKAFTQSLLGQAWQAVSEKYGIALAFAEAEDGQDWNLDGKDGRDEAAYLKAVSDNFHSKNKQKDAAFNLNERAFYVVGYDEGGAAAQEFAMTWPALVCGAASVDGYAVPDAMVEQIGNTLSYPFVQAGSMAGQTENNIKNNEVPVPMWLVDAADSSKNNAKVAEYWIKANGAKQGTSNAYAQKVYENEATRVWLTDSAHAAQITPDVLYSQFLAGVQRFVGDPGGRLEMTVSHTNNGKTGFFYSEEKIDGKIHRWYTYVPSDYKAGTDVPLVVAIHGYSSAIHAFTGDSRWQDVAEKNGFIVVFPQAYVNDFPTRGEVLAPVWHTYSYKLTETATDDVSFIRQLISLTEKRYSIDSTRVYATGHSNGATMTWALGLDAAELFAAIAPVGHNSGSYRGAPGNNNMAPTMSIGTTAPANECSELLPTWMFKGIYDVDGGADFTTGAPAGNVSSNAQAVAHWTARNGTESTPSSQSKDVSGRYTTSVYTAAGSDIPLVQYTVVDNSPHAYIPTEADMIWSQFFSKYSRGSDGSLYYEGKKVEKQTGTFTDLNNHWAKNATENAVNRGWFTGISATTFSPNTAATRGMVVTVLGRAAGAQGDTASAAKFKDVVSSHYAAPYIGWAAANKIVLGTSDTTFAPNAAITREQFAVMTANYAKAENLTIASGSKTLNQFSDAANVSDWAKEGMQYCIEHGLLSGNDQGKLSPKSTLTRAELATILNRMPI